VELFVGEKCSDKFLLEFDFHVILEITTHYILEMVKAHVAAVSVDGSNGK
jgi:hypothetical protein